MNKIQIRCFHFEDSHLEPYLVAIGRADKGRVLCLVMNAWGDYYHQEVDARWVNAQARRRVPFEAMPKGPQATVQALGYWTPDHGAM